MHTKAIHQLYTCPYRLVIYATISDARLMVTAIATDEFVKNVIENWSVESGRKVLFSQPHEPIFLVEEPVDNFWNVIIGERVGWIIEGDWLGIKELVNDK